MLNSPKMSSIASVLDVLEPRSFGIIGFMVLIRVEEGESVVGCSTGPKTGVRLSLRGCRSEQGKSGMWCT